MSRYRTEADDGYKNSHVGYCLLSPSTTWSAGFMLKNGKVFACAFKWSKVVTVWICYELHFKFRILGYLPIKCFKYWLKYICNVLPKLFSIFIF